MHARHFSRARLEISPLLPAHSAAHRSHASAKPAMVLCNGPLAFHLAGRTNPAAIQAKLDAGFLRFFAVGDFFEDPAAHARHAFSQSLQHCSSRLQVSHKDKDAKPANVNRAIASPNQVRRFMEFSSRNGDAGTLHIRVPFILLDEAQAAFKQYDDARINDSVIDAVSIAPSSHDRLVLQALKLIRDGLGLHLKRLCQVGNADLVMPGDLVQQAQPRIIASTSNKASTRTACSFDMSGAASGWPWLDTVSAAMLAAWLYLH